MSSPVTFHLIFLKTGSLTEFGVNDLARLTGKPGVSISTPPMMWLQVHSRGPDFFFLGSGGFELISSGLHFIHCALPIKPFPQSKIYRIL